MTNPYAGKKQFRCLKEFAGLQDDGGETQISLYEDLMSDDRCLVVVELLDAKGRSKGYNAHSGTEAQMDEEYERQIWAWRKNETKKAIADARAKGVYDEFEQ